MNQNSNEFKKLQADWYKKIKDKGFNDIEQEDGMLKSWHSSLFSKNYNVITHEAKEEYYRLAGIFLQHNKFKDAKERYIWERHSSGVSIRNIVKELKAKKIKAYKVLVLKIIQRLSKKMLAKCKT